MSRFFFTDETPAHTAFSFSRIMHRSTSKTDNERHGNGIAGSAQLCHTCYAMIATCSKEVGLEGTGMARSSKKYISAGNCGKNKTKNKKCFSEK